MKKNYFLLLFVALPLLFGSCNPSDELLSENPFDTLTVSSNSLRDKIVVISDLHLGSDLTYSETVKHLKRLEQFLNEVRSSATVKELVIAGDTLPKKKPDPIQLQHICAEFKVLEAEALLVGDSLTDVKAAHAAGCYIVTVPYGYNQGVPIDESLVDAHINDLTDLLALIDLNR